MHTPSMIVTDIESSQHRVLEQSCRISTRFYQLRINRHRLTGTLKESNSPIATVTTPVLVSSSHAARHTETVCGFAAVRIDNGPYFWRHGARWPRRSPPLRLAGTYLRGQRRVSGRHRLAGERQATQRSCYLDCTVARPTRGRPIGGSIG